MPAVPSTPIGYNDGYLGVPRRIGPRQFEWPFQLNGDVDTFILTETWKVAEGLYRPATLKTPHPLWNFAYLMKETKPESNGMGAVKWQRIYATIPSVQVTYPPRRYISKPEYTPDAAAVAAEAIPYDDSGGGTLIGSATDYSPFAIPGQSFIAAQGGIYVDNVGKYYANFKTAGAITYGAASAGTFTITYGASTTAALNYNDSNTTIAAAINALAAVVSAGFTVGVQNTLNNAAGSGGLVIFSTNSVAIALSFSMSATSLTVNTSKNPVTAVINSLQQWIMLPSHLVVTAHGLDTALELAVARGTETYLYDTTQWGSIDANTLWIPNRGTVPTLVATYGFAPVLPASSSYVAGWRFARLRLTETFYLPGVTAGITTPADIVPPADLQNPDDFLDALFTPLTGYQNYENDGPAPWLDFPIHVVRSIALKFEDLV